MQNSSENRLFAQKKAYIDAYVALHRHLNDVFVRKLTELNIDNLHRNPEQKAKLLFYFVHYITLRSMKGVILDFNKKGRIQQTKLFQLYQDFSAERPIEPYTLIENLAALSFPICKGFIDQLRHIEPLQEPTYSHIRADYQNTIDTITQEETYGLLMANLIQRREALLTASKQLSQTKLWHFKCAAVSLLITSIFMLATILLMHLSLQAMLIGGATVLVGAILLRVWREKLSGLLDPTVPQVYEPAILNDMFGEDFRFPSPGSTQGFLNRLDEQLASVMQQVLTIDTNSPRLTLENGRPTSVNGSSSLRIPAPSHLPIADAHTQDVLRLMDAAFKGHQPESYMEKLSNPNPATAARIGYKNNHIYGATARITHADADKPLEIGYDPSFSNSV